MNPNSAFNKLVSIKINLLYCIIQIDENAKIVLPPEIFETVPGTARVQFAYFPNSRLFRGTEETWQDTGPVIGASLGDNPVSDLTNCVVYGMPNTEVSYTS